jgi:putative nucleotidyltransferase with HDIG domain
MALEGPEAGEVGRGVDSPLHASEPTARVAHLLATMERMPVQPTLAMRVLWMCNDDTVTQANIAETVELDPVLTARLLRLANSSHYGTRDPISNTQRAVVLVGCAAVGTLAAEAVTASVGTDGVPPHFWSHSAAVATACQSIADVFRIPATEAFAAGLLHDLGAGVLRLSDPVRWDELELVKPVARPAAERKLFGLTHEEAGAAILEAWRLPDVVVLAVAGHHSPPRLREQGPGNLVLAGETLAAAAFPDRMWEVPTLDLKDLNRWGLNTARIARLVSRIREDAQELEQVLA